ncbi:uncharacterized protein LOC105262357 [Musca domestica]|uniref:Uncharacterized protein LOC105262357 n=1 Tax=Musca domestica TaxID=7370 RepID=A0A9J7IBW5_MUSDO|nr:uncharacterized protein LOC105262357 [Musca domestica]
MPGPSVIQNSTNSLNNSTASGLHMHDNDMISPVLMAKFLHDELKAGETKHCDTCQCAKDLTVLADVSHSYSVSTQTPFTLTNSNGNLNDTTTQLCLRCYSNLNSPSRTNSPYNKNLLKSSDSVISETKSSVSDLNEMDKLFTPVKKDDLMVNPILGHHRIYDRPYGHKSSGLTLSTAAKLSYNTLLDNMKSTNSYQRRFVDGGGTALDLLEEKVKNTAPVKLKKPLEDINGNDDILDEQKPLLGPSLNENIPVEPAEDTLNAKTKLRTESSCELRRGVIRDHIKSPTASTKSALEASKTSIEGMVKSAMTGSLSSVWSRSSSCEGAKMFENFNRNLIKTIKAENPKNRGPRLCAMRIQQNGQSNILLDNMESIEAITPIIYRRRERLLDEELDDGKDIITSKVALANAKLQLQQQDQIQNAVETGKEALEIENTTSALATSSVIADGESEANVTSGGTDSERPPDQKEIVLPAKDEKTDKLVVETTKPEMTTAAPPPVTCDNSCKNSAGTQYSSMADNIDFQETVILRRQQLSRVAEWVQNNSKQMEREQQKMEKLNHCESSPTDQQSSSFSTLDQIDSVSVEKMSTDSGYKTTPQFQQIANSSQDETIKTSDESLSPKSELINEISTQFSIDAANTASNVNLPESPQAVLDSSPNTHIYSTPQTYYRRTSRSGLPVAYTASEPQDSSSQCSQIIATEQPTCDIVNYKYYPSDSDKNRSSQANTHASRTETVDIAQMEYNVKQFLLKQNEWSMRTATTSLSTAASTQSRTSTRPIKLFSSTSAAGFGPGKCERIINSGPNITHSSLGMMSTSNGACGGIPQRTETNL